jgi:hypothetical protein
MADRENNDIVQHVMPGQANPQHATENELQMNAEESEIFRSYIYPEDMYTEDGTYWADLPVGQRAAFIGKIGSAESKKELAWLGNMFKADPLSPIGYYFKNMVIPGAGLLLEG